MSEILRELPPEKQELYTRRPQIWLDTSYEKANDDFLLKKVFPALDKSARLIVVSTPAALENISGKDGKAHDNWLTREVDHFLGKARADETDRPVDVVFGPGAIEDRYPGRLSEKPRWDWIDLRSFSAWRIPIFSETLDDGLAKLLAGLYDVPERFLPLLRREERRRRLHAITAFAFLGLVILALMTGIALYARDQQAKAVSALKTALETRAQMSVRLATEELQKKDPDNALATALSGIESSNLTDADRAVIPESLTAVGNGLANETFGGILHDHSDATLRVILGPSGNSAITIGADERGILWGGATSHLLRPIRSVALAGSVFAVAPENGLIASGSSTGQISFWNSANPELSPKPFDFRESLRVLAFSDSGQQIAASGAEGRLAVWDIAKESLLWAAPAPVANVSTITLSSRCACLVAGTPTGDLYVWSFDRMDGVLVRGASGKVTNAGFGRDGQFVFTTDDGRLWLTSAPSWPTPMVIGQHEGSITGFAIAPERRLVATVSIDGIARVWDLVTRTARNKYKPLVEDTPVSSVAFSADGNTVALGYGDGTVALFDVDTTEANVALIIRGHTGAVLDLSFSADGNWLASASLDRTVHLSQLSTARRPRMQQAHEQAAFHAISRNGRYLVSASRPGKKVRLWAGPEWEPRTWVDLDDQPSSLAVSDDGQRVFIGTDRGDFLEWDTSGRGTNAISNDNGVVSTIAISPDGSTIGVIGIEAKKLQVCSAVSSPLQCRNVSGLIGWGSSLAFSEDGHWMGAASGTEGETGLAIVLDLHTNKTMLLNKHTERIPSIEFEKSGKRAVTVSWDGTARIWDLSSGKELIRLVHPRGRTSAGFSPDGQLIVTSSFNKTLRLWKLPETTDPDQTVVMGIDKSALLSDSVGLTQHQFGMGGNILATSLENGNIYLWHVPDGILRAVLEGDGSPIRSMSFQPDGLQITATTSKGRLISWDVSPALGLKDNLFLAAARSMLPLAGALMGKMEGRSNTPSATSNACEFLDEHPLGLPPHKLSGYARARQRVQIADSCRSRLLNKNSNTLLAGLIAEKEGDSLSARQRFTVAVSGGDFSAEVGLGDLSFLNSISSKDESDAFEHYTQARANGVRYAASRLGWLLLARGADGAAQAKNYFEEAIGEDDADGFAGLGWINEKFGKSLQDLETAFSNYIKAQYQYERNGAPAFAQQVAERRAMLARSMPAEKIANLFLSSRRSINSTTGLSRQ